MHTWIRLADRQGLLTGRGLGTLQVRAVYFREVEANNELRELRTEQFRESLIPLVPTGIISLESLFPEVFEPGATRSSNPAEADETDMVVDENFVPPTPRSPDQTVVYRFDDVDMTPEEMEAELAQLVAGSHSVNGSELM